MDDRQFFMDLLKETDKVFQMTPIKAYQDKHNKNWNYAICETPFHKGQGLIFGLNWGGDNHNPQSEYPKTDKEERNWNFINNSRRYFDKYLHVQNIGNINYSNLCFFRSPEIKYLKWADWELSMSLFKKYVDRVKPAWTVLLGNTGVPILTHFEHLEVVSKIEVKGKKKRTYGYKGILFNEHPFYCVPHPQAKIATDVRNEVWDKLFRA